MGGWKLRDDVRTVFLVLILSIVLIGATASSSQALQIRLTDMNSGVSLDFADNAAGDLSSTLGRLVLYDQTVGAYNASLTIGSSKPVVGTASEPELSLLSFDITGPAGTFLFELTDTDFTAAPYATFESNISGWTDGIVSYQVFVDNSNIAYGQDSEVASFSNLTGFFFEESTATVGTVDPFSVSLRSTITSTGNQRTLFSSAKTSGSSTTSVPEPGALALLGVGIAGLFTGGLAIQHSQKSKTSNL